MTKKCLWCGKSTSQLFKVQLQFRGKSEEAEVCSSGCETKLRDFVRYADTHIKHYIIGFVISILVGFIVAFLRISVDGGGLGVFIIFAGTGATLIKYPLVTPQTVNLLGAKGAIASGWILGIINIFLGILSWIVLTGKI